MYQSAMLLLCMYYSLPKLTLLDHLNGLRSLCDICTVQVAENFFGICSCSSGGILLSVIVLMRVCVVTDASDDETRKCIHETSGFHLQA